MKSLEKLDEWLESELQRINQMLGEEDEGEPSPFLRGKRMAHIETRNELRDILKRVRMYS